MLGLTLAAGAQSVGLAVGLGSVFGGRQGGDTSHAVNGGAWLGGTIEAMASRDRTLNFGAALNLASPLDARPGFGGQPSRPVLLDADVVLRGPRREWTPELQVGWAGERSQAAFGCVDVPCPPAPPYHFFNGAHLGFALARNLTPALFVRLEYHLDVGKDMGHPSRVAVSVGHTFGGH